MDSGAGRTIFPRDAVPGMKVYKTKKTGTDFQLANGHCIPNLGEAKIVGKATNSKKMQIKTQVADITKPLVSTPEITSAGNIVVHWDTGGIIKQVTKESLKRIQEAIHHEHGAEIPINREGHTYTLDMDVAEGEEEQFERPRRTVKPTPMDVDRVQDYQSYNNFRFAAFWDNEEETFQRPA